MADTAPAQEIKKQSFNFKPIETELLKIIIANHNATFSAVLSQIATERFAYQVTANTQFEIAPDLTSVKISELPEDVPVAKAGEGQAPEQPTPPQPPAEEPKSGAVAAA